MSLERRKYDRKTVKTLVTVSAKEGKTDAVMVDISEGGIGIVSDKRMMPGTQVLVSIKYLEDYIMSGQVKWTCQENQEDQISYRIGIEIERIIWKEIKAISFPERADLVSTLTADKNLKSSSGPGIWEHDG